MSCTESIIFGKIDHKFIQNLINDFKTLSQETKKKHPQIKEACDEAISKLCESTRQGSVFYLVNQILYPLIRGCETKDIKIVKFSLGIIQRLITHQVIDQKGARYIADTLWLLMENGIEHVKLLQIVALLVTSNSVIKGDTLAKLLLICFHLHTSKNTTISNIAAATIRQLVSHVFERALQEQPGSKSSSAAKKFQQPLVHKSSTGASTVVPGEENPENADCIPSYIAEAFLLFQDLVRVVNDESSVWIKGIHGITKAFGLELLENILLDFSELFSKNGRFTLLLKEQVCALVIQLISPNIKPHLVKQLENQNEVLDKQCFPISLRLLRLISVLIQKYHRVLTTECEIFLCLIIKILEANKTIWLKALTLEVLYKISTDYSLVAYICTQYDLKNNATNVFQDLVNSVAAYIKNDLQLTNLNVYLPMPNERTQNISDPKIFWFSQSTSNQSGKTKFLYLEMLDKTEPPQILDGYCLSVAYGILVDTVKCISYIIQNTAIVNEEPQLKYQLITSSWRGILSSVFSFTEVISDENLMMKVLSSMEDFIYLCGSLDMHVPRHSFISALCQFTLPSCSVSLFNEIGFDGKCNQHVRGNIDADYSKFSTLNPLLMVQNPQQSTVMLTTRNLLCMKALLNLTINHGRVLGVSWQIILSTIQHLVWILGLKPSTRGNLQAGTKSSTEQNISIQTVVLIDLQVLSQMVNQLFESTKYLDDATLQLVIDALCKLSYEAMELAYANKEPSLFAVAKLLEIGIVNLSRINVTLLPLAIHFLQVCNHRHIRMREWGVEAITYLVKSGLQFKGDVPLKENATLQVQLLKPLSELSSVPYGDVRQKQLECILHILNGKGENISYGWPFILEIIRAIDDQQSETLIRTAFQCLQLVITDFLQIMPLSCLQISINTTAKFGLQTKELNISLTAIGLMWNISDFLNQNQEKLSDAGVDKDEMIYPNFPGIKKMTFFEKLWICLYVNLGDMCVDMRPAVRKSASQTLFSTISANGNLLKMNTWHALLWQVLFPLLKRVQNLSNSASSEKVDTSGNILIHHSRNTAQKQWAETQMLTLLGVSRVFNVNQELLQKLEDYPKAWALLLNFIENAALSKNNEISLAAMKSYQEIMFIDSSNSEHKIAQSNIINNLNNLNNINNNGNANNSDNIE